MRNFSARVGKTPIRFPAIAARNKANPGADFSENFYGRPHAGNGLSADFPRAAAKKQFQVSIMPQCRGTRQSLKSGISGKPAPYSFIASCALCGRAERTAQTVLQAFALVRRQHIIWKVFPKSGPAYKRFLPRIRLRRTLPANVR